MKFTNTNNVERWVKLGCWQLAGQLYCSMEMSVLVQDHVDNQLRLQMYDHVKWKVDAQIHPIKTKIIQELYK